MRGLDEVPPGLSSLWQNITAHPLTANVPTTILLKNDPSPCGFDVPIIGLNYYTQLYLYQRCRQQVGATSHGSCPTPWRSRVYRTRLSWRCVGTRRHITPHSRLASANCCWCSAVFATSAQRRSLTSSSRKRSEIYRSTGCSSTSINPPTYEPNNSTLTSNMNLTF